MGGASALAQGADKLFTLAILRIPPQLLIHVLPLVSNACHFAPGSAKRVEYCIFLGASERFLQSP
jgi:hypothetical protein